MFKRIIAAVLAVLTALPATATDLKAMAGTREAFESVLETYTVNEDISSYKYYVSRFPQSYPDRVISVDVGAAEVLTEEDDLAEYTFTVAEAGFYCPVIEYYPVKGKSSAIQRAVFLDGELPYKELALVEFSRVWQNSVVKNSGGIAWEKDNQGNDLKPTMVESPEWITSYFYDMDGYITSPLSVYLTAGEHTLSLLSLREPMLIRAVEFRAAGKTSAASYETVRSNYDASGAADTTGVSVKIEAEGAARTSSQMLYPTQDSGSPAISPSSPKTLLNNTIGGNSWRLTGQWIEWEFDVPQTGYYNMSAFVNQSYKRGIYVSRKITIDGELPFAEFADYGFTYSQSWRNETFTDKSGNPYKIYLTAGTHTLRMEAVLGDFAEIISEARTAVYELNSVYRKVIRLTGVAPDKYRDYQIETSLPDLTGEMAAVRDRLGYIINELQRVAGRRSDRERVLVTMRDQLTDLIGDNEKFGKQLGSFKINVRACGNWLNDAMNQPLRLDTITFYSPDSKPKLKNGSIFAKIGYEISRLFYSFIIKYNAIGNVEKGDKDKTITLWIGSGRDQANVIKSLIDEKFAPTTGSSVNVMLVDMGTLLQATLAGQGPDVAIQVGWDLPMNYGLRDAVLDLSRFNDLGEVKARFAESAMVPYEYNGATYALPETQVFPMMFYRKDIMAELGLSLPETWEDVNVLLATLARSQMEIGMLPTETVFTMLLYQNGGRYYNDDATLSDLDSEEAVLAFKKYCEFYTDYKLDRLTSVEERFRTGECPIIIADYTVYNNLQVSAPDLRGIWGMAPVPGTKQADGSIDRSTGSYGGAAVVMNATEKANIGWEFLKWWTSAEIQTSYGREMESLMGASARIPTANLEAFENMAWPALDLVSLKAQFGYTKGIPQVPGGYFTYRNVNNAFYSVTTPQKDQVAGGSSVGTPREMLTDKVILINDEIRYKRTEFGLPLGNNTGLGLGAAK